LTSDERAVDCLLEAGVWPGFAAKSRVSALTGRRGKERTMKNTTTTDVALSGLLVDISLGMRYQLRHIA